MSRKHVHVLLASSLVLALVVGVSRCSPISNSIDKFGRPKGATPVDVPAPMDVALQRSAKDAQEAAKDAAKDAALKEQQRQKEIARLRTQPAKVLSFGDYLKEVRRYPEAQTLSLSLDTPESGLAADALNEFRRNRAIALKIPGEGPDECRVFIGVALSPTKIEAYDLNPLASECKSNGDGTWTFSISSSVSVSTWETVAASLQGLTLYVANHPTINLGSLAPIPSPSPMASPTPAANGR